MIDLGTWRPWYGGGTSQGRIFLRCRARWWFEKIAGLGQEASEPMKRGSRLHAAWERYLLTGELAKAGDVFTTQHNEDPVVVHVPFTDDEVEIFLSTLHRLPAPPVIRELVEHNFEDLETYAPVRIRSCIDLYSPDECRLDDGRRALLIIDHKSTSSLKWAKTGLEIPNDFQACVFVVQARRAIGWTGPIVFRLIYATTRRPFISEAREFIFEPADIDNAETFVRETLHAMYLVAMCQNPALVAFNMTACDDFKSAANPDGCPHRMRCASLGRPVDTGFAAMLFLPGVTPMATDPLNDLLIAGQAKTPDPLDALLAAGGSAPVDAARAANLARFDVLRPNTTVGADQLNLALDVAETEQTRLIIEITSLQPKLACDEARAMLRGRSIYRLEKHRTSIQRPKDPDSMDRAEIEDELVALAPEVAGHFDGKPTGGLVALLNAKRAEAATANHGINSPEDMDPTAPTDTKTAAEASQPVPAKAEATSRGLRLPDEYGGGLLSTTTKKSGHMQAFLRAANVDPPIGTGSTKKMRGLCQGILTGPVVAIQKTTAVGPTEPDAVPAASIPDPKVLCTQEIERLASELEITLASDIDDWTVDKIVPELARLRLLSLEAEKPPHEKTEIAPANSEVAAKPGISSFVLFVDCHPTALPAADLTAVAAEIGAAVAKAAGVSHYLAIPYNEGPKRVAALLASQIQTGAMKLPAHVYISSKAPSGPALIEGLTPLAAEVIRGDR